MNRLGVRLLGIALSLFWLAFSHPVRAEAPLTAQAAPESHAHVVRLAVTGPDEDVRRLTQLLEELLGRPHLQLRLEVEGAASAAMGEPGEQLARVSLDLRPSDRAVCSIEDGSGQLRLSAKEIRDPGSRTLLLDEVAHLVQTSVESLLAEESLPKTEPSSPAPPGLATEPTPPNAPPPAVPTSIAPAPAASPAPPLPTAPQAMPPDRPRSPWGFDMAALAGLHGVADSAPLVFGTAAAAHLAHRGRGLQFGGWLIAEYRLPFDVDHNELPPTAETVALRGLFSVDFYHPQPWSLGAALGGGLDILRVEHGVERSHLPSERYGAPQVVPILAGFGVVELRLVDNVRWTTLVGLELDLTKRALSAYEDDDETTQLWLVRPALLTGLTFTLFGREPSER